MAVDDLQHRRGILFDFANESEEQAWRADEGVALAFSVESPIVMQGQRFGVSGGLG